MPCPSFNISFSTTQVLLLTIFGQTVILWFAWGFTGALLLEEVIALPDHVVHLIVEYPTVLTLVVTLISTALSIITSMFFTLAVKQALRHHLSGPITLFRLRTAIALTKPTWVWRWKYLQLSALTLVVYVVATFLNSSWSTLLLPTIVRWPIPMFGTELDLGSAAFTNQLSVDLNTLQQNNSVQASAFETIGVMTLLSGIAAVDAEGGVQTSSIFSFNGVSYSQSTGGVLPAIEEYSGSLNPSQFGLAFSGGNVSVNSTFDWGRHGREADTQGIAKNYTVAQQGVTANVTCQLIDRSKDSFFIDSTTTYGPVISFFTWNATANCSGNINWVSYFTGGNMNGQIDPESEGFLPVVVCPSSDPSKFGRALVIFPGVLHTSTTSCRRLFARWFPYLTTVNVTYNGGIVSVDRISTSSGPTESPSLPLSQYIAAVMAYQAGSNQGMTSNTIGDFLTAYGTSHVTNTHSALEDYWRGITEFASTQLRSGYSAGTGDIPSSMTRSTSGTMYIMTYGWRSRSLTYIFLLVMITMFWGATMLAAGYSLIQERYYHSDPSFDFSNPIHLITAASRGGLEGQLPELDIRREDRIEDLAVQFGDVFDKDGNRTGKKLVSA
ncbi:hypothetical protein DFH29DRAFT_1035361 [Suillus ampliporus]|nr:hypothetical protein DFH29DRAFT_1035361 [Suillus ampliporus]